MSHRDLGKVVFGLAVFIVLAGFPIWYAVAGKLQRTRPELEYPPGETACVEAKEYMATSHMELLNEWRDAVVRQGQRTYTSRSNGHHDMSLQNTCLDCHRNKTAFCDRCHSFVGVRPGCWGCHVEPKEVLGDEAM